MISCSNTDLDMSVSDWSRAVLAMGCAMGLLACSSTVSTATTVQPGQRSAAARAAAERGSDLFPSAARIEELLAGSAGSTATTNPALEVSMQSESWRLTGVLPDTIGSSTRAPRSEDEYAVARTMGVDAFAVALDCMAEQAAYYRAQYDGDLPRALTAFMALRCGSTDDRASLIIEPGRGVWAGRSTVTGSADSSRAFQTILRLAGANPADMQIGYWSGNAGGRDWTVVAMSHRDGRIDPMPMAVNGTEVRITGSLPSRYRSVSGAITWGGLEARDCRRDDSVRLPQFAMTCPVNSSDDMAVVTVAAFERGEILGSSVAQAMLSPSGTPPLLFEISAVERGELWSATTGYTNQRVHQFVNALRQRNGLPDVAYLAEQSTVNDGLLPYMIDDAFIEAQEGDATDIRNTATIAAMAGHRVPGEIIGMDFTIEYAMGQGPVKGFFSGLQLDAHLRDVLLSPDVDAIAVASRQIDNRTAIMVSSFEYYEDTDLAAEQTRFLERVNRAREANGNRPLVEPNEQIVELMNAAGGSLAIGEYTVEEVMQIVANYASNILNASVHVYIQRAPDMDEIEIPEQLLRNRSRAAVNVSSHAEPGTNWRQYVVTFITW